MTGNEDGEEITLQVEGPSGTNGNTNNQCKKQATTVCFEWIE